MDKQNVVVVSSGTVLALYIVGVTLAYKKGKTDGRVESWQEIKKMCAEMLAETKKAAER